MDLIEAARQGKELVCGDLSIDELAKTEDPRYVVRAELIRELLLGRHGDLDPRGIWLTRARITGTFDLSYVDCAVPLTLRECVIDEPVDLANAHLAQLDLSGTHLVSLLAQGLRTDGNLLMRTGFQAISTNDNGVVQLLDAGINGNLEMIGAHIINGSGSAINGNRLHVGGSLFMRDDFQATGTGDYGAVNLLNARVGGVLDMTNAALTNSDGLLVDIEGTRVEGGIFLPPSVICPAGATTIDCCQHAGDHIHLAGCTYSFIERSSWQEWLHLIRCHSVGYWASPYQQLAAAERAAGHDGNARRILIAQQQDLHARGSIGGPTARFGHWVWGLVAGYGYRARRTAIALLIALVLAGGLGWWAGHWSTGGGHHAAERTATSGSPAGTPCSQVEQIGLGIDRGLPLASAGIRSRCDLDTGSTAGQVFTLAIWVLQGLVWALATLAIAGYTGLIRKPA